MTTTVTRILTLFDPDDKHQWYDNRFNNDISIRITDSEVCLKHIGIPVTPPEFDVHLFFPDTQAEHIWNRPADYVNTIKYIYCKDQTSVDSIRKTYGRRFAQNIFTVGDLEFEISHVQVKLWRSLAKLAPAYSDQCDRMLSIAKHQLEWLSHSVKQMMTDQPSEESIERH